MALFTAQQFIDRVKDPEIAEKFANEVLALLNPIKKEPKKEAKKKSKTKGGE